MRTGTIFYIFACLLFICAVGMYFNDDISKVYSITLTSSIGLALIGHGMNNLEGKVE